MGRELLSDEAAARSTGDGVTLDGLLAGVAAAAGAPAAVLAVAVDDMPGLEELFGAAVMSLALLEVHKGFRALADRVLGQYRIRSRVDGGGR